MVITDAIGRTVKLQDAEMLAAGTHSLGINTAELAPGLYNVTIQTEKGKLSKRLSVTK
jgi:hypothetical protein